MSLPFVDGNTVMVCSHLYDRSSCKVSLIIRGEQRVEVYTPPRTFLRLPSAGAAGSVEPFKADGAIACVKCAALDPRNVDYIETIWHDGRGDVADLIRETFHLGGKQ